MDAKLDNRKKIYAHPDKGIFNANNKAPKIAPQNEIKLTNDFKNCIWSIGK
jgi:hypothetical protein